MNSKTLYIFIILSFASNVYSQSIFKNTSLSLKKERSEVSYRQDLSIQNYHQSLDISKYMNEEGVIPVSKHDNLTLFLVAQNQNNVQEYISLENKGLKISNNEIKGIKTVKINQDDHPKLISYIETVPIKHEYVAEKFNLNKNTRYFEVITYEKGISNDKVEVVESYLAMKFGITLYEKYVDSKNESLWLAKENGNYTNSVICIGRDDSTGLYQKQSINYDKSFAVGVGDLESTNYTNKSVLKNKSFTFISDNGKVGYWNDEKYDGTNRVWKINSANTDEIDNNYTFEFDYEKILGDVVRPEYGEQVWLVLDKQGGEELKYGTSEYIRADIIEGGKARFTLRSIEDLDQALFSIVKSPKLKLEISYTKEHCENSAAIVKVSGGIGEKKYNLFNEKNELILTGVVEDNRLNISGVPSGIYRLVVQDAHKREVKRSVNIKVEEVSERAPYQVMFSGEYHLDGKSYIPTDSKDIIWEYNGLQQKTNTIIVSKGGMYNLNYKTPDGCQKQIAFNLVKDIEGALDDSNVSIYPNPIKSYSPFNVEIALISTTDVKMYIYNISGQLIKEKDYNGVNQIKITETLEMSGEYFIVIKTNQDSKTFKIIVQ